MQRSLDNMMLEKGKKRIKLRFHCKHVGGFIETMAIHPWVPESLILTILKCEIFSVHTMNAGKI
jgi:hypothetical protein